LSDHSSISTPAATVAPAAVKDIMPAQEPLQNDLVSLLLHSDAIQFKLAIGAPDDTLEHEADAMADTILRMPSAPLAMTRGVEGEAVQRKCHCEEEENLQRKPLVSFIQRKESSSDSIASDTISSQINASKGSGSPMDNSTQTFMQSRFGTDFSDVKIHTGGESVQMNRDLNARAFTVGKDIYFNEGQYNPSSNDGKHLLAHELTHTVQQGNGINKKLMRKPKPDEPAFYEAIMGGKIIYAEIKEANLRSWYYGYKFFNLFKEEEIYPGSQPNAYATRVYELQEKLHQALGESYPETNITGELEPDYTNSPTLNSLLGLAQVYEKDTSNNFDLNTAMLLRLRVLVKSIEQKAPPLESQLFQGISQLNMVNSSKSFSIGHDDRGIYVERIQMALVSLNYDIGKELIPATDTDKAMVTGKYGKDTQKAVEQFQMDSGMEGKEVDGVVGQITLRLLDQRLAKVVKTNLGYSEANIIGIKIPVTEADIPKDPADAERIKNEMLLRSVMQLMPLTKEEAQNLVKAGWQWILYRDVTLNDVAKGYIVQSVTKGAYETIMGSAKKGGGVSAEHLSEQVIDQALFLQNTGTLYDLNAQISNLQGEINSLNSRINRMEHGKDSVGAPQYMYDELSAKQTQLKEKQTARDTELKKLGISPDEYDQKKGDFVKTFLQYSAMIAFKMLAQNEAKANVEYQHYGNTDEVKKLKETVTTLNQFYTDSETYFMQGVSWEETGGSDINKYKTRSDYVFANEYCDGEGICNGDAYEAILRDRWKKNVKERSPANNYYAQLFDQEAKAFAYLKEKAATFPILGSPKFNVRDKGKSLLAKSDEDLRDTIRGIIGASASDDGIIKNIADTREKIRGDVSVIWEMPPVIALAKMELGILEGTVLDKIINDAYKAHQDKGFWETLAKAALGIGLGLLALVSGPVGWVALGASIAYGAYDAYTTYKDIKWKTEASETAIDEDAMALMHDKPSMIWFAVSLVGIGLDGLQALKLVKAVKIGVELSEGVKTAINEEIATSKLQLNALKQGTKEAVDISRRIERLEKALLDIDWVHYAEHSKILTVLKDNPFAVRFMANALKEPATAKAFTKLAKIGLSEELMTTVVGMYAGVGKKAIGEFPEVMRLIESGKLASHPELVKTILTDLKVQKVLLDSGDPAKVAKLFTEWEAGTAAGKTLSFADHLKQAGLNTFFQKGIVLTERYGPQFSEMSNLIKNKLILREIEPLLVDALNAKKLTPNVQRALELSLQRNVLGLTNDMGVAQERMAKEIALLGSTMEFQSDYLKTVALLQNSASRKMFWEAAVNLPARDEYLKMVEEIAATNPKVKSVMDDLIKIGPVKDKATIERLIADDVLRRSLADNPLAVMALKKCASPCFPPTATADQITRLTKILTGKSPDQIAKVNELIYANRASEKTLEAAIVKLETAVSMDEALKSVKVPEAVVPSVLKNTEGIKSLAETAISLGMPSSQMNNIMKNIAAQAGAAATSRVEGVLGDLIMVLQIEKKTPMKNLGKLLSGLESADTGIFKTAEFLTDEIARFVKPADIEKGLFTYPGLQKADKLLETFSLTDMKGILQTNKLENGFINGLYSLTQKVKGTKSELLDLMAKTGSGGKSDMEKLMRILGSQPGQVTYKDAVEAIAKSKAFAADVAAAMADKEHGFEKIAKLVWGEDAVVKDGAIEVADKYVKGDKAGSEAFAVVMKEEGKKLALANLVSSGGKVNYDKWKVLKSVIENSNISRPIKNNIIGELWTTVHVSALEQDGWKVLKEVKLSDGVTVAKADAVAIKGDQMVVLEFKSLEGVLSEDQKIIYPMLQDGRIKMLKFTENAEADAFFAANRGKVKYRLMEEAALVPST
jgi:Holliday junction resolvase